MTHHILVTGGAGFIGTCFVMAHAQAHPEDEIVVYDSLTYAGNEANLKYSLRSPQQSFIHASIASPSLVQDLLDHSIDTVVHFAAESHVDRSISGPDVFIDTNINGTYALLKSLLRYRELSGVDVRLHHVSTDEVYGALQMEESPFTEISPYLPNSPYSASKAASDCLVHAYATTYGLKQTTSHCSNNFGPFQHPEKLIPKTIITLLEGRTVPIYGSGLQVRDWLSAFDHCAGIELCLEKGRLGQCYNFGANNELTNLQLIEMIGHMLQNSLRALAEREGKERYPLCRLLVEDFAMDERFVKHVDDRKGHDFRYALDCSKAEKELGFTGSQQTAEALTQQMAETVQWYLENEAWWRPLIEKQGA